MGENASQQQLPLIPGETTQRVDIIIWARRQRQMALPHACTWVSIRENYAQKHCTSAPDTEKRQTRKSC